VYEYIFSRAYNGSSKSLEVIPPSAQINYNVASGARFILKMLNKKIKRINNQ